MPQSFGWGTRSHLGTIFGGSIRAAVDAFPMLMLIKILGPDYIVWDKAASVQFQRPGRSTLYATVELDQNETASIRSELVRQPSADRVYHVDVKDGDGASVPLSRRPCTFDARARCRVYPVARDGWQGRACEDVTASLASACGSIGLGIHCLRAGLTRRKHSRLGQDSDLPRTRGWARRWNRDGELVTPTTAGCLHRQMMRGGTDRLPANSIPLVHRQDGAEERSNTVS